VRAAQAQRAQADAERLHAQSVLERTRTLAASGMATQQALDDAQAAARAAVEAVSAADAQVRAAQAGLIEPGVPSHGEVVEKSPVTGFVTRVLEPSERTIGAGTPVIEVSDKAELEAAIEFLSQDAVRIAEGMPAEIYDWGGKDVIPAVVRRVEPSGFTKVSALGVEEQRTLVRLKFIGSPQQWQRLAVGYRVWGRVYLRRESAALKVPLGALTRSQGQWAVFRLDGARAHLQPVQVGAVTDREAEVRGGLAEGDRVVVFPSDAVVDGVRIRERR
jgi:HlyD family secretion protein